MAGVHVTAAALFALRRPAIEHGSARALLSAIPSLLVSGLAFRLGATRVEGAWLVPFATGAVGTCASLAFLGRSFAILPARRELVARGPYRWVRHPAYACELVMVGTTAIAGAWGPPIVGLPRAALSVGLLVAAIASVALRAHEEERFLGSDPAYRAYAERVRFRLVPLVW